jgi:hypothetical protein
MNRSGLGLDRYWSYEGSFQRYLRDLRPGGLRSGSGRSRSRDSSTKYPGLHRVRTQSEAIAVTLTIPTGPGFPVVHPDESDLG